MTLFGRFLPINRYKPLKCISVSNDFWGITFWRFFIKNRPPTCLKIEICVNTTAQIETSWVIFWPKTSKNDLFGRFLPQNTQKVTRIFTKDDVFTISEVHFLIKKWPIFDGFENMPKTSIFMKTTNMSFGVMYTFYIFIFLFKKY